MAIGARLEPSDLRRFLDRLDRLMIAIEGYASPELTLDALLLSWPRTGLLPEARHERRVS